MAIDFQEAGWRVPATRKLTGSRLGIAIAVAVALLVAFPVISVIAGIGSADAEIRAHLVSTVLSGYVVNTVVLMVGVGVLSAALGVGAAWLVTMYTFPGRRILEWALFLPLAVPAYVMAYVYTDLLEFAGPVQTLIRDLTGWGARDYWFPDIRSLGGAIVVMAFVLYPYVYMLARNTFLEQSVCVLEVSRTLGQGPWSAFARVAVPLARPAIAAGLALVLMETIADFGTVYFFGVQTFTTGIYRTWYGMGARPAAVELAGVMLMFVVVLLIVERWSRGQSRYHHTTNRYRPIEPSRLTGASGVVASIACAAPVAIGFLIPAGVLLELAITRGDPMWGPRFLSFATNSFMLASVTAGLGVGLAVLLAYAMRNAGRHALVRFSVRLASLGYAVPGSVIAVGIYIPLAGLDNTIDGLARQYFGISTGLLLSGTMVIMVYAYLVRFLAVSYNTVEASLTRVSPNMDAAARTLGKSPAGTLRQVHLPLIRGGMITAGLLVFVDVMKELPATMILRPLNLDTLAVRVHRLASDERLAEASTGALTIVAVGIVPVILLSRMIARSRPGADSETAGAVEQPAVRPSARPY